MGVVISMRNQEHSNSNHEPTTDMNGYNNIAAIDSIPWKKAPSSDSGLRAFARRHGFYPRRTNSGMWAVCWSSTADAEEYPTAIEAIKAEVEYRRR